MKFLPSARLEYVLTIFWIRPCIGLAADDDRAQIVERFRRVEEDIRDYRRRERSMMVWTVLTKGMYWLLN